MKKHRRNKLQLNRETLRKMHDQHAARVAGGICSAAKAYEDTAFEQVSFPPMQCCLQLWGEKIVPKRA